MLALNLDRFCMPGCTPPRIRGGWYGEGMPPYFQKNSHKSTSRPIPLNPTYFIYGYESKSKLCSSHMDPVYGQNKFSRFQSKKWARPIIFNSCIRLSRAREPCPPGPPPFQGVKMLQNRLKIDQKSIIWNLSFRL